MQSCRHRICTRPLHFRCELLVTNRTVLPPLTRAITLVRQRQVRCFYFRSMAPMLEGISSAANKMNCLAPVLLIFPLRKRCVDDEATIAA